LLKTRGAHKAEIKPESPELGNASVGMFMNSTYQNVYFSYFTFLDWIVFFAVLLLTFLAVIWGHFLKKKSVDAKKADDTSLVEHLLMGRQLTLPLFVATLVATWYGGIFGVTQIAFEKGIYNFITQGVFWYITYLIFAVFFVDKIKTHNVGTLPELIHEMFGPKSAKLSAFFNFFNIVPIAYTISLGLFITTLFGGNLLINTSIGVLIVILYSFTGGLRAVVFSDVIQFGVMCSAVFIILVASIIKYGGPSFLIDSLPASHFDISGGESTMTLFVWGFIALSTLVDPNFYNRVFAAKSSTVAKKGLYLSTLIWFLFDICTTSGAMYARAARPELDSAQAYLIYALEILPSGFRGLALSGILATILSTLDSYLFLAGSTLTFDILPERFKNKMHIHYLGIFSVGVISVLLGHLFEGNIKRVWKTLGSYSAACLLLPVILGYIFPKKISDNQFVFSCMLGVIFTTWWRNANLDPFWGQFDELYIGILVTTLGIIIWKPTAKLLKY